MALPRIFVSPPHIGPEEGAAIQSALAENWIAPGGPQVKAFEQEFSLRVGVAHAVAVNSGTAGLHLALALLGVGPGDEVFVSDFTFAGAVFPICHLGATPVFIDAEPSSWCLDVGLLAKAFAKKAEAGRLPKAVVVVHIYGQTANLGDILAICAEYDVPVLEDAAQALGATYADGQAGTFGRIGVYSFNGNKIVTTSGGGMLVADDDELASRARKLATQAREDRDHYEHMETGYNFQMSGLLAALGRPQLAKLDNAIAVRRGNFEAYRRTLGGVRGISFMPESPWGVSTRWLTAITIDANRFGADREELRRALEAQNIESRPVLKPMHMQPVFTGCEIFGGDVSEDLFEHGLCLPSGTGLATSDRTRVTETILRVAGAADSGTARRQRPESDRSAQ